MRKSQTGKSSGKAARKFNTFAHCYHCDQIQRDIPEVKNSRDRRVVFHKRDCFNSYLDKNRPVIHVPLDDARQVAVRAQATLDSLKVETMWFRPSDHRRFVNEEMIHQLEFILSGKEEVSLQQRAFPAEVRLAMQINRHMIRLG